MKKLRSYSFIELMVVMIIGTITIAIAYQGYVLFYKQFIGFKETSDKNATIVQLDAVLVNDFNSCKEVRRLGEGLECISKDKTITYQWSELYVLRKQLVVTDTFPISITELKFSLKDKESTEGELVDELSFIGNENLHFQIAKMYGADVLINSELK